MPRPRLQQRKAGDSGAQLDLAPEITKGAAPDLDCEQLPPPPALVGGGEKGEKGGKEMVVEHISGDEADEGALEIVPVPEDGSVMDLVPESQSPSCGSESRSSLALVSAGSRATGGLAERARLKRSALAERKQALLTHASKKKLELQAKAASLKEGNLGDAGGRFASEAERAPGG